MARVFVTRELPFPALERLREAHEVDAASGRVVPGLGKAAIGGQIGLAVHVQALAAAQ